MGLKQRALYITKGNRALGKAPLTPTPTWGLK